MTATTPARRPGRQRLARHRRPSKPASVRTIRAALLRARPNRMMGLYSVEGGLADTYHNLTNDDLGVVTFALRAPEQVLRAVRGLRMDLRRTPQRMVAALSLPPRVSFVVSTNTKNRSAICFTHEELSSIAFPAFSAKIHRALQGQLRA